MPSVCSRVERVADPLGFRAATATRTTVRQRRQRVFVVASVSKLDPQRLQVMVITALIIAPFCAIERLFSVKSHKVLTLVRIGAAKADRPICEAHPIRSGWLDRPRSLPGRCTRWDYVRKGGSPPRFGGGCREGTHKPIKISASVQISTTHSDGTSPKGKDDRSDVIAGNGREPQLAG